MQRKNKTRMKIVTFHLPEKVLELVDYLVEKKYFSDRADFFREATRFLLQQYINLLPEAQ